MRERLAHRLELISQGLPDLRALPPRRQATIAIVLSALLHLGFFLIAALCLGIARIDDDESARPKPQLRELVLELTPPPPPPRVPEPAEDARLFSLDEKREREFLDSTGLAKAEKAPEKANFESDENMIAASEKAGTGAVPLPSMDGRTGLPFTNFKSQDVSLGPKAGSSAPATPPTPPLEPAFKAEAAPTVPQEPPPPPVTPPPREMEKPPEPTPPKPPEPEKPPAAPSTPPPAKRVTQPAPNEIALLDTKPSTPLPGAITRVIPPPATPPPATPAPATPLRATPPPATPRSSRPTELARLTTPVPKVPPVTSPGYQPQQEKTKIEGNISNRGKAAADAVRTPLAIYKKQISEAVGSRWYHYIRQRTDLITLGEASFTFTVDRRGKVRSVVVLSNTSNRSFANLCEQSIREAEFAPPPPEAELVMKNGVLEVPFTFTFYDPH